MNTLILLVLSYCALSLACGPCSKIGEACHQTNDCCAGYSCRNNKCASSASCVAEGDFCRKDNECCTGFSCRDNKCVNSSACIEEGQHCTKNEQCCNKECTKYNACKVANPVFVDDPSPTIPN